jgi:folate-binding protein YgfZ
VSESPAEQALRARRSVGVGWIEDAAVLRVTGADRIPFLHRMLTCDVKGAAVGSALPGLLLTAKGKVLAEFLLAILPDRVEIIAPEVARDALGNGLAKFVIGDDVHFAVRMHGVQILSFVGPRAEAAIARFISGNCAEEVPPADRQGFGFRHVRAGLLALDVIVDAPASEVGSLFKPALAAAGTEGGGLLGTEALEILRVEAGEPALGAEATEETLPQECGMTDRVSFTKGCFVGQEPVARLQNRGHTNRGLAGLLFDVGAPLPSRGDAVLAGEKEVGTVTSAVESASLSRPIALAILRHESAAPGTILAVRSAGGTLRAEAAALPFVR